LCVPLARVTNCQLTGDENVPLNSVPLGIPFMPLPVIVNEPPAANVPPIANEPLLRAPVVKVTEPKLEPVMSPPPLSPLTATRTDPDSESPLFVPLNVPPLLVKSTPLLAKAAIGSANAKTASKISFLPIVYCLLGCTALVAVSGGNHKDEVFEHRSECSG